MSRSPAELPIWLWFFLQFAAMWVAISAVLSVLGGWRSLARSYRTSSPTEGRRFSFRSGSFGFVNYGNCLTFISGPAGLYLAVSAIFRLGHAPLFVPWQDVSARATRGWLFRNIELRFAKQPHVRLRVSRGLGEALLSAGGNPVRLQEAA